MTNILKWELLKWYYRLRWIVLASVVILAVFTLLALLGSFHNQNRVNDYILKTVSLVLSLPAMILCIIVPSANMIMDYILPYKYMEKIVQRKPMEIIAAKIFVNAVLFYIGVRIEVATSFVFTELIPNGYAYFAVSGSAMGSFILFIIFGMIIPIIILFFYMLTYYIKKDVKHRIMLMIITIVIAYGMVYLISKVSIMSKLPEIVTMVVIIIMIQSLPHMIENKYEPK